MCCVCLLHWSAALRQTLLNECVLAGERVHYSPDWSRSVRLSSSALCVLCGVCVSMKQPSGLLSARGL